MITTEFTQEKLAEMVQLWQEVKPSLKPTRRSGIEVARYLMKKYKAVEFKDPIMADALARTVMFNSYMREKLAEDAEPSPVFYRIPDEGAGAALYKDRTGIFAEVPQITVSIDISSGCYNVEGSEDLWDELCAYQGLDATDLDNPVCVYEYVQAMEKEGKPLPR